MIEHLAVGFLSEAPFAHLLASLPLPAGFVVLYFLSTDLLHASDLGLIRLKGMFLEPRAYGPVSAPVTTHVH